MPTNVCEVMNMCMCVVFQTNKRKREINVSTLKAAYLMHIQQMQNRRAHEFMNDTKHRQRIYFSLNE